MDNVQFGVYVLENGEIHIKGNYDDLLILSGLISDTIKEYVKDFPNVTEIDKVII